MRRDYITQQGETFLLDIEVVDIDGNPVDVEEGEVVSKMKPIFVNSASVSLNATPSGSTLYLSLSPDVTSALVTGRYLYDVLLTLDNITTKVLEGTIDVMPTVSL